MKVFVFEDKKLNCHILQLKFNCSTKKYETQVVN